jgi:BASS family bile acid:Na+ symporter
LINRSIFILQRFLPLWIIFFAVVAFLLPDVFKALGAVTSLALALIFLFMGMSISYQSFLTVIKRPKDLILGMGMKWIITVAISVALAYLFFRDNASLAAGIILAGTVPSGTSANLYTLLAEGTPALSITLAAIDTVIAPFMTPVLMQVLAGHWIPVSFWSLFLNIVYIVFIPIMIGLVLQWKWSGFIEGIKPFLPLSSILALFVIVLGVVASAYESIMMYTSVLPLLIAAVFVQVAFPMAAGYYIARLLKVSEPNCRAMLFHVGICNTALSATLAMNYIDPLAAVPSVVNMVINLTLGAFVANVLGKKSAVVHGGAEGSA